MSFYKLDPVILLAVLAIFLIATPALAYEPLSDSDSEVNKAYSQFIQAWISAPPDFKALSEKYHPALSAYVKDVDSRFGASLDKEISAALIQGQEGKNISANRQVVQKALQHAFISNFMRSLKNVSESKSDEKASVRIAQSAPIIKSIAGRRDQWLGKGTEYQDTFDFTLNELNLTRQKGELKSAAQSATQLQAFTNKLILLSTLYELDGLEKARGTSAEKVATKVVEAGYYYRSLSGEHKTRNAKGAATVAEMLAEAPEQMDIDLIQKILFMDFQKELAGLDKTKLGI